jgi:septin family protein
MPDELLNRIHNMNTLITYRHLVLLVILLPGLSACAGKDMKDKTPDAMTEQFRLEILESVQDPERAEKAAKLAGQLREQFVEAERQYKKDFDTFRSLNANYDANKSSFQGFFMNMNNQARARQKRVLEIHAKMQKLLTAEEWETLEKSREKALNINLKYM